MEIAMTDETTEETTYECLIISVITEHGGEGRTFLIPAERGRLTPTEGMLLVKAMLYKLIGQLRERGDLGKYREITRFILGLKQANQLHMAAFTDRVLAVIHNETLLSSELMQPPVVPQREDEIFFSHVVPRGVWEMTFSGPAVVRPVEALG